MNNFFRGRGEIKLKHYMGPGLLNIYLRINMSVEYLVEKYKEVKILFRPEYFKWCEIK